MEMHTMKWTTKITLFLSLVFCVSSMASIAHAQSCTFNANQIVIWEDNDYLGRCKTLDIGLYPHSEDLAPVRNDKMSSVQIVTNVKVTLYRDGSYGGSHTILTNSQPALPGFN